MISSNQRAIGLQVPFTVRFERIDPAIEEPETRNPDFGNTPTIKPQYRL